MIKEPSYRELLMYVYACLSGYGIVPYYLQCGDNNNTVGKVVIFHISRRELREICKENHWSFVVTMTIAFKLRRHTGARSGVFFLASRELRSPRRL
jgi:hypothetical protein